MLCIKNWDQVAPSLLTLDQGAMALLPSLVAL